jgi:diguanylate cyclase (GGDEF)-like protein
MYVPRILVVEQDPALLAALSRALVEDDYPHTGTDSPEEALRKLQDGSFDVLLVDPEAGSFEGLALMETVRARFPSVEVIALSHEPTVEITAQALRLGAYDFLFKPIDDLSGIRQALRRVSEKIRLSRQNLVLLRDLQAGVDGVARLHRAIDELNEELLSLYGGAKARGTSLEMHAIFEIGVTALSQLCAGRETMLLLYDPRSRTLRGEATSNPDRRLVGRLEVNLAPEDEPRFDQIDERHAVTSVLRYYLGVNNLLVVPLSYRQGALGLLVVLNRPEIPLSAIEGRQARQFARWLSYAFENGRQYRALLDLAMIDGLTGLYNHRFFQDRLRSEVTRAARHRHPVSLLFCDIDDFKNYNDRNGHAAGDALLEELGKILRHTGQDATLAIAFRDSDIAARYGGEEFAIILPETPTTGAIIKAERLRQAIERTRFAHSQSQPLGKVTVSIGVAEFPADANERNALLDAADRAMYRAKKLGKNQVVSAATLKDAAE